MYKRQQEEEKGLSLGRGTWYNRRGMAVFWIIKIEPRLEMPAKGRASPKAVYAYGIIGVV